MSQEAELQTLREELKAIQNQTHRSRRRAAVGFVSMLLIVIVFMVYGFVQRIEAERNAELAFRERTLAEASMMEAERNALEARRQQALAMNAVAAAESRAAELAACCKRKR